LLTVNFNKFIEHSQNFSTKNKHKNSGKKMISLLAFASSILIIIVVWRLFANQQREIPALHASTKARIQLYRPISAPSNATTTTEAITTNHSRQQQTRYSTGDNNKQSTPQQQYINNNAEPVVETPKRPESIFNKNPSPPTVTQSVTTTPTATTVTAPPSSTNGSAVRSILRNNNGGSSSTSRKRPLEDDDEDDPRRSTKKRVVFNPEEVVVGQGGTKRSRSIETNNESPLPIEKRLKLSNSYEEDDEDMIETDINSFDEDMYENENFGVVDNGHTIEDNDISIEEVNNEDVSDINDIVVDEVEEVFDPRIKPSLRSSGQKLERARLAFKPPKIHKQRLMRNADDIIQRQQLKEAVIAAANRNTDASPMSTTSAQNANQINQDIFGSAPATTTTETTTIPTISDTTAVSNPETTTSTIGFSFQIPTAVSDLQPPTTPTPVTSTQQSDVSSFQFIGGQSSGSQNIPTPQLSTPPTFQFNAEPPGSGSQNIPTPQYTISTPTAADPFSGASGNVNVNPFNVPSPGVQQQGKKFPSRRRKR
jgi:hypothetical protein